MKQKKTLTSPVSRTSPWRMLSIMVFSLFLSIGAFAQAKVVTGTIIDGVDNGPLLGASVTVKGKSGIATVADSNGKFTLKGVESNDVLVFSMIGYKTQNQKVGNRTTFNLVLNENIQELEELVVVGYQTQRKVDLTSAISHVGKEVFENRPVSSIGQALQGAIPNLNIDLSSGSLDAVPNLNIRGGTNLVKNDKDVFVLEQGAPLILVDGIAMGQSELNQMNPNDIADISVLKDAGAAAIYGTRASNGVMIITTKRGSFNKKATVGYSFEMSWDTPASKPRILDSYSIQELEMEKKLMMNKFPSSEDEALLAGFKKWRDNPVPQNAWDIIGGNVKWLTNFNPYEEAVKDWSPTQKHDVRVTGGSDKVSYYVSLGMQKKEGMYNINTDEQTRYNFAANFNAKVTDWFNLGASVSYYQTKHNKPETFSGKGSLWSSFTNEVDRNINMPIWTDESDPVPNALTDNILAGLYVNTRADKASTTILTLNPEFTIIPKMLIVKSKLSYSPRDKEMRTVNPASNRVYHSWDSFESAGSSENKGSESKTKYREYSFDLQADFKHKFGKHDVSALVGVNQERDTRSYLYGLYRKLLNPQMVGPSAVEDPTLNKVENDWHEITRRAMFFRATYQFAGKYNVEVNGRYDGSSKFPKSDRFQIFPTVSLGWRISEEKFMDFSKGWLDNFKFRGTWGILGSVPDKAYPYQTELRSGESGYLFEGQYWPTAINPGVIPSPEMTWPRTKTLNGGIDFTMLKGRLSGSFDIYEKTVYRILTEGAQRYPAVLGTEPPNVNSGEIRANGWELTLNWKDQLTNGIRYGVGFNIGDTRNRVRNFVSNFDKTIGIRYEGERLGEIWGYTTGGILQESDFDGRNKDGYWIWNGADQTKISGNDLFPGTLWYKDLNGDGIINSGDNTVANPGDRKIIGNSTPRYKYGITLDFSWKGFDFNALFQGVGKKDTYITDQLYWGGGAGSQYMRDRSWRPDRTDARFPMYNAPGGNGGVTQTGYLIDASYFRMKQLVVGYTLPKHLTKKLFIEKLRFNVSAFNIFEITDVPKEWDVDLISRNYPMKRTVAIGAQIEF